MLRTLSLVGLLVIPSLSGAATLRIDVVGDLNSANVHRAITSDGQFASFTISRDQNSQYYDAFNTHQTGSFLFNTEVTTFDSGQSSRNIPVFTECQGMLVALCQGEIQGFNQGRGFASVISVANTNIDLDFFSGGGLGSYSRLSEPFLFNAALPYIDYSFAFDGTIQTGGVDRDYIGPLFYRRGSSSFQYDLTSFTVTAVPLPAAFWGLLMALGGFGLMRRAQRSGAEPVLAA